MVRLGAIHGAIQPSPHYHVHLDISSWRHLGSNMYRQRHPARSLDLCSYGSHNQRIMLRRIPLHCEIVPSNVNGGGFPSSDVRLDEHSTPYFIEPPTYFNQLAILLQGPNSPSPSVQRPTLHLFLSSHHSPAPVSQTFTVDTRSNSSSGSC